MVMGNCHDCDGHGGWRVEYNRDVSSTALSHTQTHTHSLAQGARLRHGSCTGSVIVEQGEGLHLRLERGEDVHLAAARQRPALTTHGAIAIAIAIACETELPDKGPSPPFPLSEGPYPPSTGRAAGLHDGQLTCIFGLSRSTCSVAARPRSRPAAARRPGGNARSEAGRAQGERRERGAESREQGRSG